MQKPQMYTHVDLPDDTWRQQGKALRLPPHVRRSLFRFGMFRVLHGSSDGVIGLMILNGPPGTGKSDAVRWAADAVIRAMHTTGNALVINAASLMDEHLGKSQKHVDELIDTIAFSAHKKITVVIFDDAEAVFTSRRQSADSNDPSDVGKATTVLFQGMDRLRFHPRVLQYATLNIEGLVDEAILSRCDVVIPFALPHLEARTAILARKVQGLAGERVLTELAAATEGKSGRDLNKINLLAYLEGTGETLEDLTEVDYLRAVGITPHGEPQKEAPCVNVFSNGFQATTAQTIKLLSQPTSSTQQPNCSTLQNGTSWSGA